jgi:hypothetical protein
MLVEQVNRYLNKGHKIMTNERNSIRVALVAMLLLVTIKSFCNEIVIRFGLANLGKPVGVLNLDLVARL